MTGFAVFTVAALGWLTASGQVPERLPERQISPTYATKAECLTDLKNRLNARFASAAQQAVKAAQDSDHNAAGDTLTNVRAVMRCYRTPLSADVKDAIEAD